MIRPRAITLKPPIRIEIILALIAANLLLACTHGLQKEAEKEISLPPSFTTTDIRMGMSLEEAQAAYPQQKPDWARPRTISFQFTKWQKVSAAPAGMVVLPLGVFRDERLSTILSIVAFKGKFLEPAEINRLHGELLKECEALYGADHDQAVTHKSSTTGNEYSETIWNKVAFKATLILPRIKNQKQTQKIAALEVVAREKKKMPNTSVIDAVHVLFGAIGF